MKKRWAIYMAAGILFGIFDFYFQYWVMQGFMAGASGLATMVLVWGVWLVLVIPIAMYEAKVSRSAWRAAAASAFTWSVSVVAYYAFMGVKLILIGEPSRPEMHISSRSDPYYWRNFKSFFEGDFVAGVGEWIGVALVGGCLVGLVCGLLMLRAQKMGRPGASAK